MSSISARIDETINIAPRRGVLKAMLATAIAGPFLLSLAAPATAQQFTRFFVTLRGRDRDSAVQDLFNALSGTEYRLVEAYQDRPVLVLDVTDEALRRLRQLPMVARVAQEDALDDQGSDVPRQRQSPSSLLTYALTIRSDANFDRAVREISRRLDGVRHQIVRVDPGKRRIIVAISERDMPVVGALDIVQSAVVVQEDMESPPPQRVARVQSYIVQYEGSDPRREIRRIRSAMEGFPFKVLRRMDASRMIVVETNQRGLRRLQQMRGIRVWRDTPMAPL